MSVKDKAPEGFVSPTPVELALVAAPLLGQKSAWQGAREDFHVRESVALARALVAEAARQLEEVSE